MFCHKQITITMFWLPVRRSSADSKRIQSFQTPYVFVLVKEPIFGLACSVTTTLSIVTNVLAFVPGGFKWIFMTKFIVQLSLKRFFKTISSQNNSYNHEWNINARPMQIMQHYNIQDRTWKVKLHEVICWNRKHHIHLNRIKVVFQGKNQRY
jgi:hypothetical protein